MSENSSGIQVLEVGGKVYNLKFTHRNYAVAEGLLGKDLFEYRGGGVNLNMRLGLALMDGQHGVKTLNDVADLMDIDAKSVNDAINFALLDFFQKHYPHLAKPLIEVMQAQGLEIPAGVLTGKEQ